MKTKNQGDGYNERLFGSGIRGKLHLSRFKWLHKTIRGLDCRVDRVLELGCFDAKTINFLPKKPSLYVGFDADWEDGLSLAREKWKEKNNYHFRLCNNPNQLKYGGLKFDISICMGTLEHVHRNMVDPYLNTLSSMTERYILITVPNELGLIFLIKHLIKRISGDYPRYSLKEILNTVFGRTQLVAQKEHKGFNYKYLIKQVSKAYDIVDISGYPFPFFPPLVNHGVGILAKVKDSD